jgi:superfamily II DNA or RNA helicase
MEYTTFLQSKRVSAPKRGFLTSADAMHLTLFPWQREIVAWALQRGTAALFEDTGLGKTAQEGEWARHVAAHTGRKVLVVTPLAVAHQWIRECKRLINLDATYVRNQDAATAALTAVVVTNYDMVKHFDAAHFGGVVLDESSILKNYTGATKRLLLSTFANTPYRLAATATPAPNDYLELGNHAEFLGIMPSNEMIMRWFVNDTMKAGGYRLKRHAESDFWQWVASWACCIGKPSHLGYSDDGYNLPPLNIIVHAVEADYQRAHEQGQLFFAGNLSATAMWGEKRATLTDRVAKAAQLINERPDTPWVIWCDTNDEADALAKLLPEAVEVRGNHSVEQKERRLLDFSTGETRVLITKAEIAAFGLNWQHCHNTVYVGLTYSFEKFYQSVKRFHRFGQMNEVNAHLVVVETEGNIYATLQAKQQQHREMQAKMVEAMQATGLLSERRETLTAYTPGTTMTIPAWLRTRGQTVPFAAD